MLFAVNRNQRTTSGDLVRRWKARIARRGTNKKFYSGKGKASEKQSTVSGSPVIKWFPAIAQLHTIVKLKR